MNPGTKETMRRFFPKQPFVAFIVLMAINTTVVGQKLEWFSYHNFSQPFIAEMYSSLIKMETVSLNKLHPLYYKSDASARPFIEVQTGYQLPVFLYAREHTLGNLKIALSTPVSILTMVDLFESETAPVINTDYRFGIQASFLFTPAGARNSFIRNYHVTLVPIFHESTHLGDEFVIHGYNRVPDFVRINVSYEAWQAIIGINRLHDNRKRNLSAEIGYQRLMPFQDGYYNVDSFEVQGVHILPSQSRDLWFFRSEYVHPVGRNKGRAGEVVFSTEIRREPRFGYTAENPERPAWSGNVYIGYRVAVLNTPKRIGIYYRHYRGIVPYGQLRDQDGFVLHGVSLILN